MTPVRLEPAAPRSRVKHSTTEPPRFNVCRVVDLIRTAEVNACIMYIFGKIELFQVIILQSKIFNFFAEIEYYQLIGLNRGEE